MERLSGPDGLFDSADEMPTDNRIQLRIISFLPLIGLRHQFFDARTD